MFLYCNKSVLSSLLHLYITDFTPNLSFHLCLKVNSLEKELTEWRLKLKQLHTDYDKLLFFHIPKMLRMFKMLYYGSSVLESVPQLVQEVSFLFDSTVETREHITATLQVGVLVCTYVCVCMCASACVCVCLCVHILLHVPCPIHLHTTLTSIC